MSSKSSDNSTKKIASFEPKEQTMSDTEPKVCESQLKSWISNFTFVYEIEWPC